MKLPISAKVQLTLTHPRTAFNTLRDALFGVGGLSYPRVIDLFVTERCNFACAMCHVKDSMGKNAGSGDLPFGYVIKIVEESKRWGSAFQVIGGEPTLYPKLLETLNLISASRMPSGMTTNGLRLEEFAQDIVQSGLNFLAVSLDGWDEQSQKLRGKVNGSFDKIIKGVEAVLRHRGRNRFPIVRIGHSGNKKQLYELA